VLTLHIFALQAFKNDILPEVGRPVTIFVEEQLRTDTFKVAPLLMVDAETVMTEPMIVDTERLQIFDEEAFTVVALIVVVVMLAGLKVFTLSVEKFPLEA